MKKDYYRGKVAVVTGGASGIGKAIAERLCMLDAKVVVIDVNSEAAKETAASMNESGGIAIAIKADVSNREAMREAIDITVERFGRIDYIFNNAGIALVAEFDEVPLDFYDKQVAVNLNGTIYGSRFAYNKMIEQGFGHIVNVASIAGLLPGRFSTSYAATKFGVVGFTLSLRTECKKYGINASVVCPSAIKTDIFSIPGDEQEQDLFNENLRYIRFITPERCAELTLRGVARKSSIIPVGFLARQSWWLWRLSPRLFEAVQQGVFYWFYDRKRAENPPVARKENTPEL
jgi:NAD(P)-dependent dehydrogenase (short-subunit alcohol dehydrogenase family)